MAIDSKTTKNMIITAMSQGMQTFSVYEVGTGRLFELWEAPLSVANGEPCLITYMKYDGTSSRIVATKEVVAQWDDTKSYDNV